MKEAGEIVLADEFCKLIVGAVIRGGQSCKCSRVEAGSIPHRRHELSRPVDEQRAARLRLAEETAQGFSYRGKVVLCERPVGRAGGHLAPFTARLRAA